MPSHDAAYTNCQPQTRWPRILRQTVQTLPGVPTRNTSAARPALPGTSTSTSGSCPWSSSLSISPGTTPLHFGCWSISRILSCFTTYLDAATREKGPTSPLVPVLFDTFQSQNAMVHKVHF